MKSSLLPVSLSHTVISKTPPLSSYRWRSNCSLHCGLRVFGTVCTHNKHTDYKTCSSSGGGHATSPNIRSVGARVSTPCCGTSAAPTGTWRKGHSVRWGPWGSGSGPRSARCWRFLARAGISDGGPPDAPTAAAGLHTQIQALNVVRGTAGRWAACWVVFLIGWLDLTSDDLKVPYYAKSSW